MRQFLTSAPFLYSLALFLIGLTVALTALGDWCLDWAGQPTITDWLRLHQLWFWVPAALIVVLLVALALHLFGME